MNKKLISAILALFLCICLAVCVSAAQTDLVKDSLVRDAADILSAPEEYDLNAKLQSVSETYKAEIRVVTLLSVEDGDVNRALEELYDSSGFGYGENHDGVLLMVCMDPREYRILSNGFAGDAITESDIDAIGERIVSDLSAGNYADAFYGFIDECEYYLNGYINGFPFDADVNLALSVFVGFVISLIVTGVWKGQLKSVRKQDQANVYVKKGSLLITQSGDYFMYRNIIRTERPKSSSSGSSGSSGGSSRSIGGGSF